MSIKVDISRLQYPMENLSMPRSQKNKNQTNPVRGKQEHPPIGKYASSSSKAKAKKKDE